MGLRPELDLICKKAPQNAGAPSEKPGGPAKRLWLLMACFQTVPKIESERNLHTVAVATLAELQGVMGDTYSRLHSA